MTHEETVRRLLKITTYFLKFSLKYYYLQSLPIKMDKYLHRQSLCMYTITQWFLRYKNYNFYLLTDSVHNIFCIPLISSLKILWVRPFPTLPLLFSGNDDLISNTLSDIVWLHYMLTIQTQNTASELCLEIIALCFSTVYMHIVHIVTLSTSLFLYWWLPWKNCLILYIFIYVYVHFA